MYIFQEEPVISEMETSYNTIIKKAPLSAQSAKPRRSSISTFPKLRHAVHQEIMPGNDSESGAMNYTTTPLGGGWNQVNNDFQNTDEMQASSTSEHRRVEYSTSTEYEAGLRSAEQAEQLKNNQEYGQMLMDNKDPGDGGAAAVGSNQAMLSVTTTPANHNINRCHSPGTIIRIKSKEEQLKELDHLPSIKKKRDILKQRIQGSLNESDDDDDTRLVMNIEASRLPQQIREEKSLVEDDPSTVCVSVSPTHTYMHDPSHLEAAQETPDVSLSEPVDPDRPPPPPLSTHPEVLAAIMKEKGLTKDISRRREELDKVGLDSEDQSDGFEDSMGLTSSLLFTQALLNANKSVCFDAQQSGSQGPSLFHIGPMNTRRGSKKKKSIFRKK